MRAWKNLDGSYRLQDSRGSRYSETYARRDQIKSLGGRWDAKSKHWTVPAAAVDELKAERMYGVILAPACHLPERFGFVSQHEVDSMSCDHNWCSYCDSRCERSQITEVLGEPDIARSVYDSRLAPA